MLKSIALKNFRNFESAEFSLDARSLVFLGANGRGKSSDPGDEEDRIERV